MSNPLTATQPRKPTGPTRAGSVGAARTGRPLRPPAQSGRRGRALRAPDRTPHRHPAPSSLRVSEATDPLEVGLCELVPGSDPLPPAPLSAQVGLRAGEVVVADRLEVGLCEPGWSPAPIPPARAGQPPRPGGGRD
ncbi:hypothetical protein GCM10010171_48360 [Actinokineospora fastidiosa]|uniref:Uncharacterized protein n=1 Tax=Actinokineospora fastidiosa TaxID=1816 RepID=A0A918GLZ9_9PSEU|nr:hypothetical protein GCM10010171_48360 [Actinokineospora fastidiosa]